MWEKNCLPKNHIFKGVALIKKIHFAQKVSDKNKTFVKKNNKILIIFYYTRQNLFLHVSDQDKQKNVIEVLNFFFAPPTSHRLTSKIKMLPDKGVHLCSETPKLGGSTVYI